MKHDRTRPVSLAAAPAGFSRANPLHTARPRVLSIGLRAEVLRRLPRHILAPMADVTRLNDQTALARRHLLGRRAPELVLSPLEAPDFEVLDLVRSMARLGYRGRFLALARNHRDINMIRDEIAAEAPTINLDVVTLDGRPLLHSV